MSLTVTAVLIAVVAAVVFGLCLFRLVMRPRALERLRRSFEMALNQRVTPLQTTIERLTTVNLRWSGITITTDNLRLQSDNGHVWVGFRQLTVGVSLADLVFGRSLSAKEVASPLVFSGATVKAVEPLAPFSDMFGTAQSIGDSLRFEILGGSWEDVSISRGTVDLTGLGTPEARAEIAFDCNAPADVALQRVTTAPLCFLDHEVVHSNLVEGAVEATIRLAFRFEDLPRLNYEASARFDKLKMPLGNTGLEMTRGTIDIVITNDGLDFKGTADLGGIPTRFGYSKPAVGHHETVSVDTDDCGAIADRLTTSGRLVGGHLKVALSRGNDGEPWAGPVHLHDIRIVRAPLLARLLTMASFPGLLSRLTSDGLSVDTARSEVAIESGVIRCTDARISVDQLEITGSVVINIDSGLVEGDGLLIPAASFQRLVGAVPVVSALLDGLGRKGSPVVATRFSLTGSLSHPEIKIEPPTGLAPNILRELGLS